MCSIVEGQKNSAEGPDFSFLVSGLVGQQVGNIPSVVIQNWYKSGYTTLELKDNNRLYSIDGKTRYATSFAIFDKDEKILLVNRAIQEQEIINEGADLSHAAANIHPISIHYKLALMQDPEIFAILGSKITSVEFTGFAIEEVNGNEEKICIMPVWIVKTDFDSSNCNCFYNIDEISGKVVTAKVSSVVNYLKN